MTPDVRVIAAAGGGCNPFHHATALSKSGFPGSQSEAGQAMQDSYCARMSPHRGQRLAMSTGRKLRRKSCFDKEGAHPVHGSRVMPLPPKGRRITGCGHLRAVRRLEMAS